MNLLMLLLLVVGVYRSSSASGRGQGWGSKRLWVGIEGCQQWGRREMKRDPVTLTPACLPLGKGIFALNQFPGLE